MCQKKADGGSRCETFAKKDIADHQIVFSGIVQKECEARGLKIDPASLELTREENAIGDSQMRADPKVQKARAEVTKANQNLTKLKGTLTEALGSGDLNRFATLIRQNDPELQAITDDNEARKTKFAEAMAKAQTEGAKNKAMADNAAEIALLNDRKVKLNELSKKEAVGATNLYRRTGNSSNAVNTLTCLQKANEDTLAVQDRAASKIRTIRKQQDKTALAEKLRKDPAVKYVEASESFRNSPTFQKWEAKDKSLKENYRMTSGYQNNLSAKIAADKKAGKDTTGMEAAYKALTMQKAKFEYKNIAEFHGPSSPQAQAAIANFNEVKQKEHSF